MFSTRSRYAALATTTLVAADGRTITYVRRRFLPQSTELDTLARVIVKEGDRLDLITARTLGDAEQYWRVCDANDTLHPKDLFDESTTDGGDSVVRIPVPKAG